MATLLAALFVCLGTEAAPGSGPHPAHERAARTTTPVVAGQELTGPEEYVCPYERGDCSLFPSLSPAVLSAPPLDPPLHAEVRLPRLAPPAGDGPARRADARPRAPDLHVLQVLRT